MGSVGKKIKKVVKKVMRPKVLLPLAALAIGGPMLSKGLAAKGGLKGALLGLQGASGGLGGVAKATAGTQGLFGSGGLFNLAKGTVGQGIMAGLKNPLSLKGAATYGGLGLAAAGLLGGGDKPRPGSDVTGAKAQSMYDSFLQSGRLAGYTDDEINTIFAPYGDMYAGDYDVVRSDPRRREVQFPGTNYPLYVANGGRIGFSEGKRVRKRRGYKPMAKNYDTYDDVVRELDDPILDRQQKEILEQMREMGEFDYATGGRAGYAEGDVVSPEQMLEEEELQKKLIMDALFPEGSPGANEDAMAEQMYNMQMQEMMSPRMGRAGGGIMQVAPGVPAGMELDYRNTGGFIPMGGPEKADDVPAMLSRNEFVMTADAVRGMGDGDVNAGAQKMYDLMNNLEAKA